MKTLLKSTLVLSLFYFSSAYANTEVQSCLNELKSKASVANVSQETFNTYTKNFVPDMSLLKKLDSQPEFKTPIWDYISSLVDDTRIEEGKAMFLKHQETLQKVYEKYGVDPYTVVAVWGVESNYGKNFGKNSLVQSLGTLSCFGRRQNYFRGEFFATLRILQDGDIRAEDFKGSWAGAFGHTQFMPTTFEEIAVDFDGDNRRDLINSVPDALASTANFLKRYNWSNSMPWGYEVKLPADFDASNESRKNKRNVEEWKARGVKMVDGSPLPEGMAKSGLLNLSGVNGPVFLVNSNFDSIYRYNTAESYALAIAHLSDRIRGKGAFVTPWPTDDMGLSRSERTELQNMLIAKGYNIGQPDGILGEASRVAIRAEQTKLGQESTGRAGQKLFKALKASQ